MQRIAILVLLTAGGLAGHAQALDLGNIHLTTGPLGSKRTDAKLLPGDMLFVNFDIDNLKPNAQDGMVTYQTRMEVFDSKDKRVFAQVFPPKRLLLLGGSRMPTYAVAILDPKQEKGAYKVKITALDVEAKKKDDKAPDAQKSITIDFQVLPEAFGIVQPLAAEVAFAGTDYGVSAAVVGFKRGKVKVVGFKKDKFNLVEIEVDKMPKVTVTVQVLDETGNPLVPKEAARLDVQDQYDPALNDLTQLDVIPVVFPLFLNRPGRFTIVLEAEDKFSKQKKQLRLPLRVLSTVGPAGG